MVSRSLSLNSQRPIQQQKVSCPKSQVIPVVGIIVSGISLFGSAVAAYAQATDGNKSITEETFISLAVSGVSLVCSIVASIVIQRKTTNAETTRKDLEEAKPLITSSLKCENIKIEKDSLDFKLLDCTLNPPPRVKTTNTPENPYHTIREAKPGKIKFGELASFERCGTIVDYLKQNNILIINDNKANVLGAMIYVDGEGPFWLVPKDKTLTSVTLMRILGDENYANNNNTPGKTIKKLEKNFDGLPEPATQTVRPVHSSINFDRSKSRESLSPPPEPFSPENLASTRSE